MRIGDIKPALIGVVGAVAAALCCLLPLVVIVLGLGSGAFMAVTMRYQGILLPLGTLAVAAGYLWYLRERRRCQAVGCTMAGRRLNLVGLGLATVVLLTEVGLVAFPEAASRLLTQAMVVAADRPELFEAQGTIVALDPDKATVTIDHGEIKGLMSPMTMVFSVESEDLLKDVAAGDRVTFRLLRTPTQLTLVALMKAVTPREARVVLAIDGMT